MSRSLFRSVQAIMAALLAAILAGCHSGRPLPAYEPPLARTGVQNVRTTAYTHTEADHVEYGNHNALGGTLHAAGPVTVTAAAPFVTAAAPLPGSVLGGDNTGGFRGISTDISPNAATPTLAPPIYGSAAADWSRWPAGTEFRIISTGQYYRVDDYGWALSGRNTIDLYEPSRAAMNAWGVRQVPIEIVQWGDRDESLRRLRSHQNYRHIKRMVLELEGHARAAARLQ